MVLIPRAPVVIERPVHKNRSLCQAGLQDCWLLGEGNVCVSVQSASRELGVRYTRQLVCEMVCPEE